MRPGNPIISQTAAAGESRQLDANDNVIAASTASVRLPVATGLGMWWVTQSSISSRMRRTHSCRGRSSLWPVFVLTLMSPSLAMRRRHRSRAGFRRSRPGSTRRASGAVRFRSVSLGLDCAGTLPPLSATNTLNPATFHYRRDEERACAVCSADTLRPDRPGSALLGYLRRNARSLWGPPFWMGLARFHGWLHSASGWFGRRFSQGSLARWMPIAGVGLLMVYFVPATIVTLREFLRPPLAAAMDFAVVLGTAVLIPASLAGALNRAFRSSP